MPAHNSTTFIPVINSRAKSELLQQQPTTANNNNIKLEMNNISIGIPMLMMMMMIEGKQLLREIESTQQFSYFCFQRTNERTNKQIKSSFNGLFFFISTLYTYTHTHTHIKNG